VKARPRLLFLCQTLPYPPDLGVHIRTYHVLRLLSAAFDVTALCFYRRVSCPTPAAVESALAGLRPLAAVEAFPIEQEHRRARLLWDHLRSLLTGRVYTVFAHRSRHFRRRLEELLRAERFDLAHVDSLDLGEYLPLLERHGVRVVCAHHNVESALLARRAAGESSRWRRAYMAHQARLYRRQERRLLPRPALNVAVSPADAAAFADLAPGAPVIVVPNGVDVHGFRPAAGPVSGVVFVGGITWYPNRDALDFFSRDILPRLAATASGPAVQWVGRCSDADRRAYAGSGVELAGYVDDIRPYVERAACFVVPLRIGGGTRLKVLDAWAMGKAVVSTSIGCEGLDAVDGENILIRDSAEDFARAVALVLSDPALRDRLGRGARLTAEQRYAWDVIGAPMVARYLSLAALV
jgi:glycosyltransferase involved in cell wall biosynthesis